MINSQKKTVFWLEKEECSHCWLILNFKETDGLEKCKSKTKISLLFLIQKQKIIWKLSRWQSLMAILFYSKIFKSKLIHLLSLFWTKLSRKLPIDLWFISEIRISDTMKTSDSTWLPNFQILDINLKLQLKFCWSTLPSKKKVSRNN